MNQKDLKNEEAHMRRTSLVHYIGSLFVGLGLAVVATSEAAETALPQETAVTRNAFELRYGKPLFTRNEFEAVFRHLYGMNLDQFFALLDTNSLQVMPDKRSTLAEAVRLFGNKSDTLKESYVAIQPRVFVKAVHPNTIAEDLGLKAGDEILSVYNELFQTRTPTTEGDFKGTTGLGPPNRIQIPLSRWSLRDLSLIEAVFGEARAMINMRWRAARCARGQPPQLTNSFQSAICVLTPRGNAV